MNSLDKDFEEIYRLYAKDVYRFILRLCRNEVLAEDILQNTMLKAITSIDKFDGACSIKSWLCTIARNDYFNYLKKAETKNVPLTEDIQTPCESPESAALSELSALELNRKIHSLSEPYREVFMLRFYAELKFSEIGGVFGKSESWARVSYFRAKAKLAEMIEKEELL